MVTDCYGTACIFVCDPLDQLSGTLLQALGVRLTLCNPMDYSPPGSSVHRTLQARILEWVAISFSRGSSQLRDQNHISYVSCIGQVGSLPLAPPGKPCLTRDETHAPALGMQRHSTGLPGKSQVLSGLTLF